MIAWHLSVMIAEDLMKKQMVASLYNVVTPVTKHTAQTASQDMEEDANSVIVWYAGDVEIVRVMNVGLLIIVINV